MDSRFFSRLIWGLLLIAAGVIFLMEQMGLIRFDLGDFLSTYWPVVLIVVGLKGIAVQKKHEFGGSSIWSVFLILLGILFLGRNLGWFEISFRDFFQYLFPLLLIVLGISMIFRPYRYKSPHRTFHEEPFPSQAPDPIVTDADHHWVHANPPVPDGSHWTETRHKSSFIGDLYLGHDVWDLHPMNISSFIGDTTLDLTKANIPFGETKLNISAFIGDVKIFVPHDADIELSVSMSCFLGDLKVFDRQEGGIFKTMSWQSPHYPESDRKIRIIVSMFIGDVKITRVG